MPFYWIQYLKTQVQIDIFGTQEKTTLVITKPRTIPWITTA